MVDQGVINFVLDQLEEHVAFVEVKLTDTRESSLSAFNAAVNNVAEIEQCHMIAGSYDYLLKVRTQNMVDYRRVLGEKISALPQERLLLEN